MFKLDALFVVVILAAVLCSFERVTWAGADASARARVLRD